MVAQSDPIEQTVSRLFTGYKKHERSDSPQSPTPAELYDDSKQFVKAKMMPMPHGQRFMPITQFYKDIGYNAKAFKVPP